MKNEGLFKKYMTALSELHGKELSHLLNSLYWKALEPFSDEQCERVFKEMIFGSKFFPKPADFLEALQGKKEDQAALAWVKVIRAIRQIGPYQSIRFADDPAIHSVIQSMGGWTMLCDVTEKELTWKQKEFEKLYSIMKGQGKHPTYLPGIHERDNAANGYKVQTQIIQIGGGERPKEISA